MIETKEFFVIPDDLCLIETCSLLKGPSCDKKYVGSEISINSQSPDNMVIMQNVPEGYVKKVCLKCSTALKESVSLVWTVT